MPLYDYRCAKCGQVFEEMAGPEDEVACRDCGGRAERLLSAPGRVGVSTPGGKLQCGKETTCCGASEPCGKPGCHK